MCLKMLSDHFNARFAFQQNLDEVSHCVAVLKVLRLATQTALHKEELCWLVFNGNYCTLVQHLGLK